MKKKQSILFVFCLFLIVAIPFSLNAKDIYVRSDSNGEGTKAFPYGSVDDALRDAFSGDVIHVAIGDYFGAGGCGKFVIDKPNITLVGGYNKDFSERNPFKNITRLMRGEDPDPKMCRESPRCTELVKRQNVPQTKASYNPKGIVVGESDHTGFVIDGFVIDGYTRHKYKPNEDLSLSLGPIGTPGLQFNKPGVKVRNNIIMNIAGPGILMNALGTKVDKDEDAESGDDWGEVSNNIIINTLMQSIDFRAGNLDDKNVPNGGCALIKNNTLVFNWELNGEDYNILQGRQTRLTIQDNILAFAGFGINNGFGNRFGRYIGNVFFSHTQGHYRYWDQAKSGATLIVDNPSDLSGDKCKKKYACSKQSKANVEADPKFKNMDKFFFDKFMNQIASQGGGKVNMDTMNQWRSMFGLPLQGSAGTGKVNFAPIWDPGNDWSNVLLFADDLKNKGVQANGIGGAFQAYKSKTGDGAVSEDIEFEEMEWEDVRPNKKGTKTIASKPDGMYIQTKTKIGSQDPSSWYMPEYSKVSRDKGWVCYRDKNREVFFYIKKGSPSLSTIEEAVKTGMEVIIKGKAYDISTKIKSQGRIGIMVMEAETDDDD
ncbi:MAG: hypothetical protein HQK76_10840 [Desulfobacterales bacterium]|nr:hypothetical protein [Desulfobacterales bacterium]